MKVDGPAERTFKPVRGLFRARNTRVPSDIGNKTIATVFPVSAEDLNRPEQILHKNAQPQSPSPLITAEGGEGAINRFVQEASGRCFGLRRCSQKSAAPSRSYGLALLIVGRGSVWPFGFVRRRACPSSLRKVLPSRHTPSMTTAFWKGGRPGSSRCI